MSTPSPFTDAPALNARSIHAVLRQDIVTLRPPPGERLSENELALRFGTSRAPVRETLEVAIIRQAAAQGISAAEQARIEATVAAQLGARDDPERFTQLDDRYHRALAEPAGLAAAWAIVEREKAQFDRVRFLSLPATTPVSVLVEQHRGILAAVLARDPAAAEQAMHAHMTEVLKITRRVAEQYPDFILADL